MIKTYFLKYGSSHSKQEIRDMIDSLFDFSIKEHDSLYFGVYFRYSGLHADTLTITDNHVSSPHDEWLDENYKQFCTLIEISITTGRNKDKLSKYKYLKGVLTQYPLFLISDKCLEDNQVQHKPNAIQKLDHVDGLAVGSKRNLYNERKTMTWIPLSNIDDETKIWVGTRVRLYNIGLNVDDKAKDYYEYLTSFIYGNDNYFQLVCNSGYKAGNIICVIKKDLPNQYALGKELKHMMGLENTFIYIDIGEEDLL